MKMRSAGFSIIELVVVLSVLGVLAALLFPIAKHQLVRQQESDLKQALFDIRNALDAYQRAFKAKAIRASDDSGYPADLSALTNNKDEYGKLFLRAIPRDPFAEDLAKPAIATWVIRSYESPPSAPQVGASVYDVYSSSAATGTNGISYREW